MQRAITEILTPNASVARWPASASKAKEFATKSPTISTAMNIMLRIIVKMSFFIALLFVSFMICLDSSKVVTVFYSVFISK